MKQTGHHILLILLFIGLLTIALCACGQDDPGSSGAESTGDAGIQLQQGEEQQIHIKAADDAVWSSGDEKVAKVTKDGKVIAGEPGVTEITVETNGKTYKYTVQVGEKRGEKDSEKTSSSEEAKKKKDSAEEENQKKKDSGKKKTEKTEKTEKADSSTDSSGKTGSGKKKTKETGTPEAVENSKDPWIWVSTEAAKAGDQDVTVQVNVRNNPGILGMLLTLRFNDKYLTLKDAANGKALKGVLKLTKPGELADGSRFLWDGIELEEDQIKDGVILTLTFDVSSKAKKGDYAISVSYDEGDIIDGDLASVKMGVADGRITVN